MMNDLTPAEPALCPRPAHVPEHLVVDFDMFHPPGYQNDVHLAWKTLHNGPDIVWTPHAGGHWIVTRATDIEFLQKHHDPYSMRSVLLPEAPRPRALPLESDPPEHTGYRAIVSPWFTPKNIEALGAETRRIAIELAETLRPQGRCEFIHDVAKNLPIAIFCQLTQVPWEDKDRLLLWTDWCTRGTLPQRLEAIRLMGAYVTALVAERRAKPGTDIISDVVQARINGEPLSDADISSMIQLILFGGLDTVASTLGFIMRFLAMNPGHQQQLVDNPALIPAALEELLRRHNVSNTARTVTRDTELGGVFFKAGDKVLVPPLLGSLDERRYANPLEVDFQRKLAPHFGFGNGPHRCPGSFLARTEMRVFLEEWIPRIARVSLDPDQAPVLESGMVHGVVSLPLVF